MSDILSELRHVDVETSNSPRDASEILAAREAIAPHLEFLETTLHHEHVSQDWLHALDDATQKRIEILIGLERFEGESEGLGFALGEDNALKKEIEVGVYTDALKRIQQQPPTQTLRSPEDLRKARHALV